MKIKTAKVIKEYKTLAFGYDIVVPVGSIVSNQTACGPSDEYRFWQDWHKIAKELTGYSSSILAHDLTHYGLNVPTEYCEKYKD